MTSSSAFPLPGLGSRVTRRLDGHTIDLIATAPHRWSIAETIGHVVVGHGEIAALNDGYIITTPTGTKARGDSWPELLDTYLHSAA